MRKYGDVDNKSMCDNALKRWNERIGVDEWLRVPLEESVFIIGNCARFVESIGKPHLLDLDQVFDSTYESS